MYNTGGYLFFILHASWVLSKVRDGMVHLDGFLVCSEGEELGILIRQWIEWGGGRGQRRGRANMIGWTCYSSMLL
ncbi:hypothetical protein BJ875DRAFT_1510 [Amylocarpus encephaloides]|uniref:Uncharacterized protein n=1 Tax=Amylocarpus encephaloides TaxID=45428 RepID=A0A9P7YV19_9HELO|nr:hypothetical protein BJ875DRAFT_1510 [Amylocarpus encephaloides]